MRPILVRVAIFASCFLVLSAKADQPVARRYYKDRAETTVSLPGSVLPTSTAAAAAPTLGFNPVEMMIACQAATITWSYQGSAAPLTLVVTNQDVSQSPSITPRDLKFRQDSGFYTTRLLSTNADPTVQNFTWSEVTVPQGYYILEASVLALSARSQSFYVTNGTNPSCLVSSTPSSPTSTASPTSSAPSSTSDAPASSSSPALDTTNSSSRHVNSGAVAGGVVGGLAVVVAVIAVFIFFRCRQSPSRGARSRAWSGLGSTDSHAKTSGKSRKSGLRAVLGGIDEDPFRSNPGSRLQSRTNSIARLNVNPQSTLNATGISNEDVTSIAPSEEKIVSPASGETFSGIRDSVGTLESVTPLPYTRQNRRSSASLKYAENVNYGRVRRANSYGNSTADDRVMNRRDSADGSGLGEAEMIPMRRSASGNGGGESTRRTPRKPVPAYDPFETPPAPTIYNEHRDDSSSDQHSHRFNSKVSLSSQQSVAMQMGLNHKGSFGEMDPNRPVHYLIPDMPPPSRD